MVHLTQKEAVDIITNWWSTCVCSLRERSVEDPFPPSETGLFESIRTYCPEPDEHDHYVPPHLHVALSEIMESDLDYFSYGYDSDSNIDWSDECKNNNYKHRLVQSMNTENRYCDMCNRYISTDSRSFTCHHSCSFDICGGCYAHRQQLPFRHLCE